MADARDLSERTVSRNFLALGAGEAAARLVAFAATVYLARTLGAGGYGIIGLALAVLLYFNYLADCGIETLGVREVASDPARVESLAPAVLTARLIVAALLAGGLMVVGLTIMPQPDGAILAGYALTLLAVGANTRWIHLGLEHARSVAVARLAGETTMATLVLLLVHGAADLGRPPLAQFCGDITAAVLLALMLRRRGLRITLRFDPAVALPVLRRAFPLVLHALLGLMIYNSDLIFLRVFRTPAVVGHYVAAYTLISFLLNLGIAYSQSLLPTLTRLGTEPARQQALYHSSLAQVFAASFPIAVGGYLLAPDIIHVVFGSQYAPSAVALAILIWTIPVAFFRNVPQMGLITAGRQDRVLVTTFVSAVLNLVLNFALIPRYGMVGAAAATLGTEVIRTGVALAYARLAGYGLPAPGRLWRSTLAGLAMGAVLVALGSRGLWLGLFLGILTYGAGLIALGGLRLRWGSLPSLRV